MHYVFSATNCIFGFKKVEEKVTYVAACQRSLSSVVNMSTPEAKPHKEV